MKQRIFSGIQPSGNLHIGNYLGAIANWVNLQDEYESIFCVVDMHAITVPQDPVILCRRTLEIAKIYLAAGINPEKCAIFIQSHIPEHAELCWILNTIVKVSELERMTQFKDKTAKNSKFGIDAGILDYPVLMAADILLYDTQLVPVGRDQKQHIELTRKLGERFNHRFGETFVMPKEYIKKESESIMSLDDPTKKMSKSSKSEYSFIALTDDAQMVHKKIKKAITDSGCEIVYTDEKLALKNLINIYSLLDNKKPEDVVKFFLGKGYAEFKNNLSEVIINFLDSFQKKMAELSDEKVLKILEDGAKKVRPLAQKKMAEIKKKVGFIT